MRLCVGFLHTAVSKQHGGEVCVCVCVCALKCTGKGMVMSGGVEPKALLTPGPCH